MTGRRVVVTGIGTINPLGNSIEEYFSNLEKGVSGAAPITHFDAEKFKTKFACEVKNYDPTQYFDRKEVRKYDLFTQYALIAATQAVEDSALSTRNDDPQHASRPFDKDRDGFVIGEGAGALILEEYEHAKARGAKIYCEVVGGGASADAYHFTAPHPEGKGAMKAMRDAIKDAGIAPEDIDYVNVHGTSTPAGDIPELKAVAGVLGDHVYNVNISSTKSMTGHLLGAAGAVEALACIFALTHGVVPPTINCENRDPEIDEKLNLTLNVAQKRDVKCALSNTFGFGGHNSTVIFRKL